MTREVVCISCHELEEPWALEVTARTALEAGFDVMIGYDGKIPESHRDVIDGLRNSFGKDRIHVVVVHDIGVGNNRNALANMAIDLGYDIYIQSDCHVMFLTKRKLLQIENNVFEHFPVEGRQLLNAKVLEPISFKYIGTFHDRNNIMKVLFIGRESKWVYFFNEPVFSVDTRILRRIADHQYGYIYLLPGYGYEVADVMLTIARLGYRFYVNRSLVYAHRINRGNEERWLKRWSSDQLAMFHANMYIYSIKHGFASPVYYEEIGKRFRDRIEIAREMNEKLPLTAQDIFDIIEKDIRAGNIVILGGQA